MIINLEKYEVKVKDHLTWGDKEEVKAVFIGGAKVDSNGLSGFNGSVMYLSKIKLMERAIIEIKEGDKVIPFSKEWAENLSVDDGDKLYSEIEKLDKKK